MLFHVPVPADSVSPSRGVPEITGAALLSGGRAATVPDGADRTVAAPAPFVAVTRTRRRNPTSSAVSG